MPTSHIDLIVLAGLVGLQLLWTGLLSWSALDFLLLGRWLDWGEIQAILVASLLTGIGAWLAEYSRGAGR